MDQTHPTRETLVAFTWRQLPAADMLALSDHLCDCAACRAQMDALTSHDRTPVLVDHFLGEDTALHLSEDEIASAAGNIFSADARAHLDICSECRDEVASARAFAPGLTLVKPLQRARPAKLTSWPVWALTAAAAVALAVFVGHSALTHTPPPLVAELRDNGNQIGIDTAGTLTGVSSLSGEDAALLAATLKSHRLPAPSVAMVAPGTTETMLGRADTTEAFNILTPFAEVTLPTPEVRWQALPDATTYRVFIYDRAFNLAAQSPDLTQLTWTVDKPLTPGQSYIWVVKAKTPHGIVQSPRPPAPEAHFTIADAATTARIVAAQHEPTSHLLLATLYASNGMTTLARAEVKTLQQENPNSPLVQELANSLPPATP